MGSIWKGVLTFAVILVIGGAGMTVTAANVDVVLATDYLDQVAAVIQESNYNEEIVQQCIQKAEERDYRLEVTLYQRSGQSRPACGRLRLSYQYHLNLFQSSKWKMREKLI